MSRMIRMVALIGAMSTWAAAVPASMDSPASAPRSIVPAAPGATDITPAEPPAKPNMIPGGPGVLIIPGAILIGVAAAVASGGGNDPAPFPATSGTTGTL